MTCTLDDMIAESADLRRLNDEGWTVAQMTEACGRSRFWVAQQVKTKQADGTCERGWKHLTRIDGYTHKASVYKFKEG